MSRKILVLEDEPVVLNFVRTVLQHQGDDVLAARTVKEARTLISTNGNAKDLCMVVDVVLGQESGIAFAQEVIDSEPSARVLFMSGFTDDVLIGNPAHTDRVSFLRKPFTREELVGAVEVVCKVPVRATKPLQ